MVSFLYLSAGRSGDDAALYRLDNQALFSAT